MKKVYPKPEMKSWGDIMDITRGGGNLKNVLSGSYSSTGNCYPNNNDYHHGSRR
ncbi:MAG: hypothetical protein PQJ59_16345 [Spirochaetales bacterium]|nr:hypothetical protein [Spirochaetales bacterium]